jgi:phosphoribosyl-ATP pyrophosphohydrolase
MTTHRDFLWTLEAVIAERAAGTPAASYTARLLAEGHARIAQKVGEEGVELALAGVGADRNAVIAESADLLYHLLVLLRAHGVELRDIMDELARRHGETAPPAG